MNAYLLPCILGLLLGLTLYWTGLSRPETLRDALALRRSCGLRSGLYALGWSMALTAFLCWLAVIDVDMIEVLPLSAGTLIGGVLFGMAAGLSGFIPGTAFAGVGSGAALEALCAIAGGLLTAWLLPMLWEPLSALRTLPPLSDATLFEVTLDEPFLLGGGFLGQGCAGLLLMAIAVCIPSPRQAIVMAEPPADVPAEPEVETSAAEDGASEDADASEEAPELLPDAAPEETFVALLPGEEPLVVDTQLDEAAEETGDESAEIEPSAPPETGDEPVSDPSGTEPPDEAAPPEKPDQTSPD